MSYSSPIIPLRVGNNGAFLHVRSSPAQGSCGTKGYPCRHPGVDLAGRYGTEVRAPESGVVVIAADGASSPFGGYGPWLIVMRGDSGKYHLLAHLDPAHGLMAPVGVRVSSGQIVGKTSKANHTHWEVRTKPVPDFGAGENNFSNNTDPIAWLGRGSGIGTALLLAGGAVFLWMLSRRYS